MSDDLPRLSAADIIDRLGGATALSRRIEATRNAISNWPKHGIPSRHWPAIARVAAADASTADITVDALERHVTSAAPSSAEAA